jgi:type II secretory pathway pseudopilin PulG
MLISPNKFRHNFHSGFSLLEIIMVVAVMVAVLTLVVVPIANMRSAGNMTKACADISGILEEARSYAIANNTYVWVGFSEVDPVTNIQGTGKVMIAVAASKDGTRGYLTGGSLRTSNLMAISPLKKFENIHLALAGVLNGAGSTTTVGTGNMLRPSITAANYIITGKNSNSAVNFSWPVGGSSSQYTFYTVINFDPQGVVRFFDGTTLDTRRVGQYFELGLQQTNGSIVTGTTNIAAIQLDCMFGSVRTYRP